MKAALKYVGAGFRRPEARVATGFSRPAAPIVLRAGSSSDAFAIYQLVSGHLAEGHLLPRDEAEVAAHASRFVVAAQGDAIVACAELAPLSASVAEVRSFVVSREARRLGVGRRLIEALVARASLGGFLKLCAFTHSPAYFVHLGFSMVPHTWLPEKIAADCAGCRQFRRCGQYAVMRMLHHG
ncbi:MAG: GNAT family N-acetyltransferase [Vicinamibacterales bacterium]